MWWRGREDEQARGRDVDRHLGDGHLRRLEVGERAAELLAREHARPGLVERARGHAERRGSDGGAKEVERRHGEREALALLAEPRARRDAHALERERADGMGRDQLGRRNGQTIGAAVDEEGGQPAVAIVGGAGEQHVRVGDAGVGDEALGAVEDVVVAVAHRARRDAADVAARLRLGDGERANGLTTGDARQERAPLRVAAGERHRVAAEPLHREHRVGERRAVAEHRAQDAQIAQLDALAQPAVRRRHARLEQAVARQLLDDAPWIVIVLEVARVDPRLRVVAQRHVPLLEEADHASASTPRALIAPRTWARAWRRTPRTPRGSRASPCRSAAPAPRPRAPPRATCRARG